MSEVWRGLEESWWGRTGVLKSALPDVTSIFNGNVYANCRSFMKQHTTYKIITANTTSMLFPLNIFHSGKHVISGLINSWCSGILRWQDG